MLRSLHMKLVLIMILLVAALMTVAGALLINSVSRFYLNDFYTQMEEVFGDDKEFYKDLVTARADEADGVQGLQEVLQGSRGVLGIDGRNRNYLIYNGDTGAYVGGLNDEIGASAEKTVNVLIALSEIAQGGSDFVSSKSSLTESYMDIAVAITRGGEDYVICILDNRQTVQDLSREMFVLIIEALGFGLVISILLSFLLSKTMVTPIQRLTKGARQMAEGDFHHDIETDSKDEIGVLTDTFNTMASQLEDTMKEVENERTKLDALFLHMTDGVVAFNRSGKLIHSNPAAEEMLAQPIPVGSDIAYHHLFGNFASLEDVLALENDCLEADLEKENRSLHLLMAPFSREEEAGVLVVIHDVTQQMRTESMRREFVANVSHELRTPLTNIRSYAETLAENTDLPENMQKNFLDVILNESDRMTHIVQDLLALSQFDSGHSVMDCTRFPFEEALHALYQAVRLEAERRQHQLALDIQQPLPEIIADRKRILQVMMNIVANAIKYTPDGGKILISAGITDRQQGRVWVEVADNGIGIPPEDRERIFDRFYRVDKARSRESGGTGLGLSIAKEIMNQHGGTLTLVDRSGPGTTVRMELKLEGPDHEN